MFTYILTRGESGWLRIKRDRMLAFLEELKVQHNEEMFPTARIHMVSGVLNPKGVARSMKIFDRNVFENYGNNILIQPNRTCTEIAFEQWCEDVTSSDVWKPIKMFI